MLKITIACHGASDVPLDSLQDFQGDLKDLADSDYMKLRGQIIELGFSEPISVWTHEENTFILNGHQRVKTLRRMRDEGYEVPPLPVSIVEAKDFNEAKRKVLSLTSQFGVMTETGLNDFLNGTDIKVDELVSTFRFPEIDMQHFVSEFFQNSEMTTVMFEAKTGSTELPESEFQKFDHKCPRCNFEFNS